MKLKKHKIYDASNLYISELVDYGDFPLRFIIKVEDMAEHVSDDEVKKFGKYHVTLSAVSIAAVGKKMQEIDVGDDLDISALPDIEQHIEALNYGYHAPLFQKPGNNKGALVKEARDELKKVNCLFGFYMDRYVNRVGATGWDAIRGEMYPGR